MKTETLAAAILFSLAGSAAVLAEEPAVTANPLAAEVAPAEVESTAQQGVTEIPSNVEAAVTGASAQQTAAETLPGSTADPIEPQVLPGTPLEVTAPATEIVVEPAATASPSDLAAAGAVAAVTDTPRKPCAMQGKGRMGKGMGKGGKGQGCRKQGCDRQGKGQNNKHEQVVRRLDMIDARMAKIEAMLESLMQR